jgi:glycosyltransferase involved in cell wall biosynthesis
MTRVSVLIAVGEDAPYLGEALQSLEAQTFRDFEVLQLRQKGIHNAWNAGAKEAKGEYLAILDSDDIATKDRLEIETTVMDARPDLAAVGGWEMRFGAKSGLVRRERFVTPFSLLFCNQLRHSTVMMRKEVVLPYGPYRDASWIDYDLWCRMAHDGLKMENIPRVLAMRRYHEDNDSKGRPFGRLIEGEVSARCQLLGL